MALLLINLKMADDNNLSVVPVHTGITFLLSPQKIKELNDAYENAWKERESKISSRNLKIVCNYQEYDRDRVYQDLGQTVIYYPPNIPYGIDSFTRIADFYPWKTGLIQTSKWMAWKLKGPVPDKYGIDAIATEFLTFEDHLAWNSSTRWTNFLAYVHGAYDFTTYIDPFRQTNFSEGEAFNSYLRIRSFFLGYPTESMVVDMAYYDNWDSNPNALLKPNHTLDTLTQEPIAIDVYFRSSLQTVYWNSYIDQSFFNDDRTEYDDYSYQWALRYVQPKPPLQDDVPTAAAGGEAYILGFFGASNITYLATRLSLWAPADYTYFWNWYITRNNDNYYVPC